MKRDLQERYPHVNREVTVCVGDRGVNMLRTFHISHLLSLYLLLRSYLETGKHGTAD